MGGGEPRLAGRHQHHAHAESARTDRGGIGQASPTHGDNLRPTWTAMDTPGPPRPANLHGMRRFRFARPVVLAAVLLAACTRTINLLDPASPRFAGEYALQGRTPVAM